MKSNEIPYLDYFDQIVEGKKRIGPPQTSDWDAVAAHKIYNEIVTITRNISLVGDHSGPDEELKYKPLTKLGKLKKYWNPFYVPKPADRSKNCVMNKLVIVASIFDPRKKMQFALLCFDMLYGKDSLEYKLLHEKVLGILRQLFDEYSTLTSKSTTSGVSNSQGKRASSSHSQDEVKAEVCREKTFANGLGYERMDNLFEERLQQA
ncbi:unnamed protein product [Microthlaspi erraticum]|uniref:hAT-like transposase RNase-H fold domain-containing protein n=1 Tax=Microthlaspi erraticum TaxID=1685480 RepID=A0A6D2K4E9_9BRAS|nr:unnamed protein product [Microthlaspi erraticum]